ncbi:TIGR03747 family integrating conjugative element membrane protein [Pseudohalioglobus sediminis]|uniref:TIGR03747 family integrating conjugative element membrane protein n=1 Tax=Pseudohalioglobus sediminis TaxID=2606449 RepID=A0A5B0X082_9GAMM|nr:TIGR03747 family integrating conjugative element membrane protein [Pseudohalioglobus sediminis]KAA1192723.1 TIGR03747 family integrating conjugative element membrane protein [Pseudohalioglobus sediminis]
MVEPADPRRSLARPGTVSRVLTGIAQCLKWLIISLAFSILIEWVGMTFWWEEQGVAHSRQMLVNELQFLGTDFHRSWLTAHPMQFASDLSESFYTIAFEWTGIVDLIRWITPIPSNEEPGVRPVLHRLYLPVADYVLAGMQITQVFAVRLAILTLATPVFGLFTLVALVDGLVRRDLRRWRGGRESSFVYHYAKKAAIPVIIIAWVLYLALPFSLHPSWIILPFALAFAFAVTITASTFKKYI